jgi:thiol:disulfide interchange protein DsbD
MALVITLIKLSTGESGSWGAQNSSIGYNLVMFCVMYIFALALFDVFMLSLPGANIGANMSAKKGYIGAFFTGIFAVLAGSACTGPLLGTAIGIAFNMNAIALFSIFIFIGIGLGFPFLLISFFPKMIKILPKPGDWMTIFKEGLAVILLIFSLKFLKIVLDLTSLSFIMIHVLPFAAILLLSLKIYGKFVQPIFTKSTQWFAIIMTLVLIFCGWFFVLGVSFDDYEKEIINTTDNYWGKFSEEAVSNAINSNLPVFIDFTASWCANCKLNESRVLNKEDIKNTFNEKNVVMLKGDYTQGAKAEPVILEWLKKYNRAGVPLYLLFIPNEKEPIVFPEIISKKNILDALEKIIIE